MGVFLVQPDPIAQMVGALLMTSKVLCSNPGGSGIFSRFRQFISPADPGFEFEVLPIPSKFTK